jgi:hypothetical protein
MATIVLRTVKGSPLTNAEVDANFTNLNNELATKLTASGYTAADVLSKLLTVDGSGSGLDADLLDGLNSSATLPGTVDKSSIVSRDASGNSVLNALQLTGAFVGTSGSFSGQLTVGSIAINGGSIPISVGGTGATNASNARTNLGLAIGTDVQGWTAASGALASVTSAADKIAYFTGAGTAGVANFSSYIRTLTGAADSSAARSTLGLVIGTDVQPYDADLSGFSSLSTNGLIVRVSNGNIVSRAITGVIGDIDVVNGDGIAGAPALSVGANIPRLAANNTFAGTTNTFNNVTASTFTTSSDARLKSNVETLNNAVELVSSLRGVSYDKDGRRQIGVIAQEIETHLPEVVETGVDGFKSVAYGNVVGLLIEAIKEQQQTIKELTTRLEKLEN